MNLVKDIIFHAIIYASIILAWVGFIMLLDSKYPMIIIAVILPSTVASIIYNTTKK